MTSAMVLAEMASVVLVTASLEIALVKSETVSLVVLCPPVAPVMFLCQISPSMDAAGQWPWQCPLGTLMSSELYHI